MEAGPSTSFAHSNVGIITTGGTTNINGPVTVNSSSAVDEFPLPKPIETFHGRDDEMRELDEAFFPQDNNIKNKAVICGLGGFGKSELSKQYAYQCLEKERVKRVLWIPAENPKQLEKSYTTLKSIYDTYADKPLLIIFDNCVSQKSMADYEPKKNQNHRILVTCQSSDWRSDVKIIPLKPLSANHALQVFKSVLGDKYRVEDEHLYTTLAQSVDYIPLGIQVRAAYVEQEDACFDLTEYVNKIKKLEKNFINKKIPDRAENSYKNSIYDAMIVSVHKIKNKADQEPEIRELAHDVLCFIAFLDPDRICTDDILELVIKKNKEYNDDELKKALKLLSNFSFLRYRDDIKCYLVQHRTTQAFVRDYISKSNLQYKYYYWCLHWAVEICYEHEISEILKYADINITDVYDFYKYNTIHENIGRFLKMLVVHECIEYIKAIFKNSDEQTKNYIYQYNLLFNCARNSNVNVLNVLLPHVDIYSKKIDLNLVLWYFAARKKLEGIQIFIDMGVDVTVCNVAGEPLLFTFVRGVEQYDGDWADVFKTFKADISLTSSNNQTLLHAAAVGRQTKLVDFLIKKGLQINPTDNKGWTPLDSVYKQISGPNNSRPYIHDYVQILEQLLTLGAISNTDFKDSCDILLLKYALQHKNLKLLKLLSDRGITVDSLQRGGMISIGLSTDLKL